MSEIKQNKKYIGDGVYVSFDGYQIWLAVNHHDNTVVALEPKVMKALVAYAKELGGYKELNS